MEKYINEIICGDNVDVLREFPDESIDLTVTSPPYDNLRTYNGFKWDFESLAQELYRVTKEGGVVVWVVNDATVNGSETGASFRQALYFKEIGFRLHDTMLFLKRNPIPNTEKTRYQQQFEYMFVFSKGRPETVNLIMKDKSPGTLKRQQHSNLKLYRQADGSFDGIRYDEIKTTKTKLTNVWEYLVGFNAQNDKLASEHPAIFPERLAEDHIISWSNPGDIILDPFIGSGTTAKMAALNDRHYIGIDISEEYCELARKRVSEATK